MKKGIEKGIEKGKVEVIIRLLNTGKFSAAEIAVYTDVSEEFIRGVANLK